MPDSIGLRRRRKSLPGLAAVAGALVATLLNAAAAHVQTAPPFAQLYRDTQTMPRQIELDAEVEHAEGLALQPKARPNPTVSIMTENAAGQRPYRGFDRSENTRSRSAASVPQLLAQRRRNAGDGHAQDLEVLPESVRARRIASPPGACVFGAPHAAAWESRVHNTFEGKLP